MDRSVSAPHLEQKAFTSTRVCSLGQGLLGSEVGHEQACPARYTEATLGNLAGTSETGKRGSVVCWNYCNDDQLLVFVRGRSIYRKGMATSNLSLGWMLRKPSNTWTEYVFEVFLFSRFSTFVSDCFSHSCLRLTLRGEPLNP